MVSPLRNLFVLLTALSLAGCAAMQEGMNNLNEMAAEQGAIMQKQQIADWESDIAKGRYSGKVRVLLIPAVGPKAQSGLIQDKAIAMIQKNFANHEQFEILSGDKADRLRKDLSIGVGSLTPEIINMKASRLQQGPGVDADVVVRVGMTLGSYTGIDKKTGEVVQAPKVVCMTQYLAIGSDKVKKNETETLDIFKNEQPVIDAAKAFHEDVLTHVMINHLKAKLAAAENAGG